MKKLGIIGGMSWESSALYYRGLNQGIRQRLGGLHSAPVVLNSLEFGEVAKLQHDNDWAALEALMIKEALALKAAGSDVILIATNTMHLMFDAVKAAVGLPLLHIAHGTGQALKQAGHSRPLLLATGFTMEKTFYRGYLHDNFGLEPLIPDEADRKETHRIIYEELCLGKISDSSREFFKNMIPKYEQADTVILGCTELTMIIEDQISDKPLFDTTALHIEAAIEAMLAD